MITLTNEPKIIWALDALSDYKCILMEKGVVMSFRALNLDGGYVAWKEQTKGEHTHQS